MIEEGGVSNESDASSIGGDSPPTEKVAVNLETQFLGLRQSSSGKRSEYSTILRDSSSTEAVSNPSITNANLIRSPSVNSANSGDQRSRSRKRNGNIIMYTAATLHYHGVNIYQAASQGSLPLCVLLWGMASSKRLSLMVPDQNGNNPMHHAALAESAEVSSDPTYSAF